MRDHLLAAYRQTGRKHDMLIELPIGIFSNVWAWFCELDSARQVSELGISPLSYQEIDSWARLTDKSLSSHDVSIIKDLDRLRLRMIK